MFLRKKQTTFSDGLLSIAPYGEDDKPLLMLLRLPAVFSRAGDQV